MNFSLKESTLSEIFRILSTNLDKVDYLNLSLIKAGYNYTKMKQFLNELEYDMKLIYDILKKFQYSLNYERDDKYINEDLKKNNYITISDRIGKHLYLNDLDESNRDCYKRYRNQDNKKYSLTINILSDKHFDQKRKRHKSFIENNFHKSLKKKCSKYLIKNLKKLYSKDKPDRRNIDDNYRIYSYSTDNSHKNRLNELNNKFRMNINKNKDSLDCLNSLYKHYDRLLNKKNNSMMNNNNLDLDLDENNNIDRNYYEHHRHNSYNSEENKVQNYFNLDDNNKFKIENIITAENNYFDNNSHINNYYSYIKDYEKNNNYMREKIYKNQIKKEKSQEILKQIISKILQNKHLSNKLKQNFGNDISQKLLDAELTSEEINNIWDFIEKYENSKTKNEKNIFRGSKNHYRNYKYDRNNNDNILFKNSNRDNIIHDFYINEYSNYNHN